MAVARVTGGALELDMRHVPTDPDYGRPPPVGGIATPPIYLPPPPPGIWPPPVSIWPPQPLPPGHPMPPGSVWPPVFPVDPGYGQGRPMPPHIWGQWPPHASGQPVPPPGGEQLPEPPQQPPEVGGGPSEPPPTAGHPLPSQKFLVAIVAVNAAGGLECIGYTVVDPSLHVGGGPAYRPPGYVSGQPVPPGYVDNTLPPTEPQPKG